MICGSQPNLTWINNLSSQSGGCTAACLSLCRCAAPPVGFIYNTTVFLRCTAFKGLSFFFSIFHLARATQKMRAHLSVSRNSPKHHSSEVLSSPPFSSSIFSLFSCLPSRLLCSPALRCPVPSSNMTFVLTHRQCCWIEECNYGALPVSEPIWWMSASETGLYAFCTAPCGCTN